MSFKTYSIRGIIGLVMIITLSVLLNIKLLIKEVSDFKWQNKDSKTTYEQRFNGIKKLLPTHGIVGYISDVPQSQLNLFVNQPALGKYLSTQYALTPLIVSKSPNFPLIIGNFSSSAAINLSAYPNLLLVKDFGNGVMLFKRKAP